MIGHEAIANCMTSIHIPLELAYIGPGSGLAAIGALLAVVAGLFAAVFGFLWYPIKRVLRRRDKTATTHNEGNLT